MLAAAVAVEKREAGRQLLVINHERVLEPHLLEQLLGGFHRLRATRNGKGKTELHLTIVHGVAIRFDFGEVQGLIVVLGLHAI